MAGLKDLKQSKTRQGKDDAEMIWIWLGIVVLAVVGLFIVGRLFIKALSK